MSEITVHTGPQCDSTVIHVDWFDENNIRQATEVEIVTLERDKPRTLALRVNGVEVAKVVRK